MINKILTGIFNLIIGLVNVLLTPIDSLIDNAIPSLGTAIDTIGDFFSYILGFIPWLCSWLNFPQWFITFVIAYFTF